MKRFSSTATLLLILLAIYWVFKASMPSYTSDINVSLQDFSTDRAMSHVKEISKKPHAVGFPAHEEVRNYITSELEKIGLETSIQEGYTCGDWANYSKAINIIAKIKGSQGGKALVLLSHYDSNPHSSLGASDAGSGVATILEGVRAFLANNPKPKNDIIILITDAEELGLNGADLFVNNHPWAKNVGLVLNFEARGSGGPSYMLIETNGGNSKLIKEFSSANLKFPVANSLVYSIYKMLPNDTDLTVFREDGDIEGFNFAFIDDHFDYHTEKDTYDRLDKNTLAHQGSYLMPLLNHFSNIDLTTLKSDTDFIYFNIPYFDLISYPFSWIWPMFIIGFICFVFLLFYGLKTQVLNIKDILKGFIPLFIALIICALIGFYSWPILKWMYPQYKDMLHGFTYNGYSYIAAFVLISIAICFWSYQKFKKISTPNILVAPIFIWLLLSGLVAAYLKGASFFIIPTLALLAAFMVVINQKKPNPYLLVFLTLPALWIYAPFIKMFPVGLGLKMMVAATALTALTFFLLLPVFSFYKKKKRLGFLLLLTGIGFLINAHFNSGFSEDNAKPTSLLYVLNADAKTANWATYEEHLSNWTKQYVGDNKSVPEQGEYETLSSKYKNDFTYVSNAPLKEIPTPTIEKTLDTIIGNERIIDICITSNRAINRLDIFTSNSINKAEINNIPLSDNFLKQRKNDKLITHYVSDNLPTELTITIPKNDVLSLTVYEASNDLLYSPIFTIPKRPTENIPMPFILNDAIIITQTVTFN